MIFYRAKASYVKIYSNLIMHANLREYVNAASHAKFDNNFVTLVFFSSPFFIAQLIRNMPKALFKPVNV